MSTKKLLQRPVYRADPPGHEALREREAGHVRARRDAAVRVKSFATRHAELEVGLDEDLAGFVDQQRALDEVDATERSGVFGVVRRWVQGPALLRRRSIAEGLLERYEEVSRRLQAASAFNDELRLAALEMQAEVDSLHEELVVATADEKVAAKRILELDAALAEAERMPAGPERTRVLDGLGFAQRTVALDLALLEASVEVATDALKPARLLRDQVMQLHEGMADYVLRCGGVVREAGQRIQALGAAADTKIVVEELRAGIEGLEEAVKATEAYLARTRAIYAGGAPELEAVLAAPGVIPKLQLPASSSSITRIEARDRAEHALKEAADRELALLLGDDA